MGVVGLPGAGRIAAVAVLPKLQDDSLQGVREVGVLWAIAFHLPHHGIFSCRRA